MSHPGESIHFDGHNILEEQEEELDFEDRHREQELRDLLSKALPDDLLEDDVHSIPSSKESSSLSSSSPESTPRQQSPTAEDQHQWLYKPDAYQQGAYKQVAITPHDWGHAPPLKTTAGAKLVYDPNHNGFLASSGGPGHHDASQSSHEHQDSRDWSFEHNHNRLVVPEPSMNPYSQGLSPTTAAWEAARQGAYGSGNHSDSDSNGFPADMLHHVNVVDDDDDGGGVYHEEDPQRLHQRIRNGNYLDVDGQAEFGYNHIQSIQSSETSEEDRRYSQHYETPRAAKTKQPQTAQNNAEGRSKQNQFGISQEGQGTLRHLSGEPSMGQVHYQGARGVDGDESRTDGGRRTMGVEGMANRLQDGETDPYQAEFNHAGRDTAQLEILYQARGREVAELTAQLEALQEASAREKRILNHQLAMAQDERDGLSTTCEEGQRLLNQLTNEKHALSGQLQAMQQQVSALTNAKQQIFSELDTAKATIESLNHQLNEVQRSQPLHRAREQQESLFVGLQEKFSKEVADLREKLDASSNIAHEKSVAVSQLEARLTTSLKGADQARLEHAEMVNRLTASLQDSQKRCQELILQGSLPVVQELQVKLQEIGTSKTMAENMCQTLQEELSDLKDQIQIYEGAVDLGVLSVPGVTTHSPTTPTDADIIRNLAKEDWKTPRPAGAQRWQQQQQATSPEDTLEKLKAELSCSLQSIRAKREQVTRLQVELRETRGEREEMRGRVEQAETKLGQTEAKLEVMSHTLSETSQQQAAGATRAEECDRLKSELEAKAAECNNLAGKMAALKAEMGHMVAENDQDKKEALERCQKTCLQLHEDSSRNMREQLVSDLQGEKETMMEAHQYQLQQVRDEKITLENDLHKIKALYVELCDEKKLLEENMERTIKSTHEETMEQLRLTLEKEKQETLEEVKSNLETSHRAEVVLLQEKYRKEKDQELERNKAEQDAALKQATADLEEEVTRWQTKHADLEKNLESQIKQAQEEARAAVEQINANIKEEHEKYSSDHASELKALQDRYSDLQASLADQVTSAVEEAKGLWVKQQNQRRMSLDRTAASSLDQLKADHAMQVAEWQSACAEREQELSKRVSTAVKDAQERWSKEEEKRIKDALSRVGESNREKEAEATSEHQKIRLQLQKAKDALLVSQRDSKQVRARYGQLKSEHEAEVEGLSRELRACQEKLQEAEETLHHELQQMQTEMREANSVTMESMQERVSAIQQRHSLLVERMKAEWDKERRGWEEDKKKERGKMMHIAIQTIPSNESEVIAELRTHYMNSVKSVRASAMSYVADMQKRCQETLRSAVSEERHRVAAKMRKFYTKQVQSLRETQKQSQRVGSSSAQRHASVGDQESRTQATQVPKTSSPRASSRPTSKQVSGTSNVPGSDCHQDTSRNNQRAHIDETPRSVTHRNQEPHPIRHMRSTNQDGSSQVPQHMQRGNCEGSATSTQLHPYPLGSGVKRTSPDRILHSHRHRHVHSEGSNMYDRQERGPDEFEKLSGAGQSNFLSLQQFTDADIGTNSAALLSMKASSDKSQSVPPFPPHASRVQDNVTSIQDRNQQLKQSHGDRNITQRLSRGSAISEEESSRPSLPDDHDSFPLEEHLDFHPHSQRQSMQEMHSFNLSTNSEYADLPQFSIKNQPGAHVQDHPFLKEDFTGSGELPRRVAELQGSLKPVHPVREDRRQNLFYALGNADPAQVNLKAGSKIPKSAHEDSGINSPAYLQQ